MKQHILDMVIEFCFAAVGLTVIPTIVAIAIYGWWG